MQTSSSSSSTARAATPELHVRRHARGTRGHELLHQRLRLDEPLEVLADDGGLAAVDYLAQLGRAVGAASDDRKDRLDAAFAATHDGGSGKVIMDWTDA